MTKMVITGNSSVAYGSKLARAEVVAAYPITPQTTIVEKIAEFVGNGEMDTQYIKVESEHSAMAACIAASNTGARAFTATSAHGLALMHELLMWAAGARTPVVMANVNRAMGPPWSVWADHQDSVAQRDTGWIQLYCENNQEVLDTILQLFKACEDHEILLPGMTTLDAFYLSHTYEVVDLPDLELVDEYLPKLIRHIN
jgi:2-oxoisovalerate ferredoxin oxidoreductase alpha subunit